ncbi:hypothetical protein IWW55_003719, partial [Coemansia sp. RSA 2706]
AAAFNDPHMHRSHNEGPAPLSLLGLAWNACVSIMLIYFVVTTLEAFAQSYLAEVKSWGQHQLARVARPTKTSGDQAQTADHAS